MKRIMAMILVICLVLSFTPAVSASSKIQHNYSTYANSGIRHEICTTLQGTSADRYYTGSYTYENLSSQSGSSLLSTLRTLLTTTHTKTTSYNHCRDYAVRTDCENGDGTTVNLLYTSYSTTYSTWINNNSNGWNREHVWPQSLGRFETSGPGADLHHVRPSDQKVNGLRGNRKYGNVSGGTTAYASITSNLAGGTYSSGYFEPLDNVKGDVARIILYMYVRYGGNSNYTCSSITNVFQSVDVLLQWCALDPVDTWEMGRNEVVAAIQGNRNVFIDYPELAWLLFDEAIPADMTTPTSNSSVSSACSHEHTYLYNAGEATCTSDGYTGDTRCKDCGVTLKTGEIIPASGHTNNNGDQLCDSCGKAVNCSHGKTSIQNARKGDCLIDGYTGDTCCDYCGAILKTGTTIPAQGHYEIVENAISATCTTEGYTGDVICRECGMILSTGDTLVATGHSFGDWTIIVEATVVTSGKQAHTCSTCGETETEEIPALLETVPPTENMVPASPETDPSATTEPSSADTEENGLSESWILIIVIILAACAAGIIVFFVTNKRKKPEQQDT